MPAPAHEIEIIAHRGFSAIAPENTLAALERALEAGAHALEWDLHVSADGVPVLLHDAKLNRTTSGTGPVTRKTLAELKQLDAGSWFSAEYRGERVPTLEEALRLAQRRCRRIYPEIKGYRSLADVDEMVRLIRELDWEENAVAISLNWESLERVRATSRRLTIGPIVDRARDFADAVELARDDGNAIIDADVRLLLARPELARLAHDEGLELACWTVNTVEDARRLIELGVYWLTTNEVKKLLDAHLTL